MDPLQRRQTAGSELQLDGCLNHPVHTDLIPEQQRLMKPPDFSLWAMSAPAAAGSILPSLPAPACPLSHSLSCQVFDLYWKGGKGFEGKDHC